MNLLCRIFNHRWRHEDRTTWSCERCHRITFGMGFHDGVSEVYPKPRGKYIILNGKRVLRPTEPPR